METTRRARGVLAVGALLAAGAVVLDRPIVLLGAAAVGAWVLARQASFARTAARLGSTLEVEQAPARGTVVTDDAVSVTLAARLPEPAPVDLTVEAAPPPGADAGPADGRTVRLPAGERRATTTFPLRPRVAGRLAFGRPTVRVATPEFETAFERGDAPALQVEPRAPREVHIGEGGERLAAAFGEHLADRRGPGIELADVRPYVVGDAAAHIDWKATARHGEPHVVEFETETDRRTVLVVDHRASMGEGPTGETKLDYARQVALAVLRDAREDREPLGLLAVGEEGLSVREPPTAAPGGYARIRTALQDLTPTGDGGGPSGDEALSTGDGDASTGDGGVPTGAGAGPTVAVGERGPAGAGRAAGRLADDGTAFGAALRPFFEGRRSYVERLGAEPLFAAVRRELGRLQGSVLAVVLTDDARRPELREALSAARRGDDRAVAFVLPSVLFEPGGLADLDGAYDRYADFEGFRRELSALGRVRALEVGPRDRVDAVLSAGDRGRPAR